MTLTEALHFYNSPKRPTNAWMERNYSHFWPSSADEKLRMEIQTKPKEIPKQKKRMKELF